MIQNQTPEENSDPHVLAQEKATSPYRSHSNAFSSDELAALVIENLDDHAVFAVDLDGCITSWNPGVEQILGYAEKEFIGQDTALIFTPEDREHGAPAQELVEAFNNGRAIDERWHLRKDGSLFWASGVMTLLRDADSRPRGFAKIMRDRTDLKRAEQEQERLIESHRLAREEAELARAKAEAADKSKDRFISLISHEMRTPLTTVLGWLSLLRSGGLDTGAANSALETIERNTQMIVRLVNDLLDIERIRSDKLYLEIRPVSLTPIVTAAIESIRPEAEQKSIHLYTEMPASDLAVLGDASRVQQVLLNLLSNSIKFTPAGGEIGVQLSSRAPHVEIKVSDTGQGIEADFLPHIFDQFRQAEEPQSRKQGGLGLGLSIVHNLIKLQNGTISAESDGAGKGATFTILLPAADTCSASA